MSRWCHALLVLLAMALLLAAPGSAAAQGTSPLEQRITINVNAVPPREVLEMIARTMGGRFELDPHVTAPVTLRVVRVKVRTALDAICESVDCRWEHRGNTLHVQALPALPASEGAKAEPRLSDPLPTGERVYTVGPGVTAPVLVKDVRPQYTDAAKQAKTQGIVVLELVVMPSGSVRDVRVTRSLSPELDQQAARAVEQWVFKPGEVDGKPVPVRVHVELTFNLR
jgi:TonB family protein